LILLAFPIFGRLKEVVERLKELTEVVWEMPLVRSDRKRRFCRKMGIMSLGQQQADFRKRVEIGRIVDEAMTREVRRNFPEAEIVAFILENFADDETGEIEEIVQKRVRFNLLTKWRGC
jgi:hypothetical protein